MIFRTIALAAALSFFASTAWAEMIEIQAPESTERLLLDLPQGWTHASTDEAENDQMKVIMHTYLPGEQTAKEWDEGITVMLVRPINKMPENMHLVASHSKIVKFSREVCGEEQSIANGSDEIRNGFRASAFGGGCSPSKEARQNANPSAPLRNFEAHAGISIIGESWAYDVHYQWRSDEADDEATRIQTMEKLMVFIMSAVTACDTADSEKPCKLPTAR